jgi:hypothetical protein
VLGAVPILIQWLHRRNYTERVWAAMRFLRAATKSQSRRLRLESLLLLIIRTLILLLVAVALAEPFLESAGWMPRSPASVHRLLMIDTSLSMQYEVDGRPISERAREAARRIINESRPGDSLQVVTIDRRGRALVGRPAFDAAEVLAQLERLNWTEQFGDVAAALQTAQQLLSEAPASERTELILISDFQRSNWWPQRTAQRNRLQRSLAQLADAAQLSLIHVGQHEAVNAALGTVEIMPLPITLGESVTIGAEVLQTGDVPGSLPVQLLENDRVLQTGETTGATSAASVTLPMRWREAGWHGVELRLPADGLAADNHHWLAVNVRDELQVLLVNGRATGESLGRATDFVELALAPASPSDRLPGAPGRMVYHPIVISEAELARTDLAGFDCVFLCDVPFLSAGEQGRLQTYVRGGGGLVIAAGPQLQLDAYNQWFHAGEAPLLAVDLQDVAGTDDPEESFRFAEPQPGASPIVEPFVGNPQAGLTTANIYRYIRTAPRDGAETAAPPAPQPPATDEAAAGAPVVRVPLAFANGDPAIVESDYGSGRVLLVTTSLDDRWGSWALWPSFLPMMHRLVDHATAAGLPRPAVVGETIRREYPVQTVGLSATLQRPDGRRRSLPVRAENGTSVLQIDELTQSGLYRILLGPPLNRTELLAVNVDPRESNLRLLDERELQGTLLAGIDVQFVRGSAPAAAPARTRDTPSSLSRWLLVVALVLLLVEQVMAWNSRWGLIALLASPLVLLLFALAPVPTVVALAAALLGLFALRWWGVSLL